MTTTQRTTFPSEIYATNFLFTPPRRENFLAFLFELSRPYFLHDIDKHSIFVYNVTNLANKVMQMGNNSMYQTGDNTIKNGVSFFSIVLIIGALLFIWLFISSISSYIYFDTLKVEDLKQEQLTFQRHKSIGSRRYVENEIYFEEYSKPFVLGGIADSKMDRDALKSLTPNTVVTVYYNGTDVDGYEICQLTSDNITVLTFEDYINGNKGNQILGMIISPIMVGLAIFLFLLLRKFSKYVND